MKNYICQLFKEIERTYGTNPYDVINSIDFPVNFEDLGNMCGLYMYISENEQGIIINSKLRGWEEEFTIFHELAHYFLEHRGQYFFNCQYISRRRNEREADLLATLLFLAHKGLDLYNLETFDNIVLPKRIQCCSQILLEFLASSNNKAQSINLKAVTSEALFF
jgi:Zn-dependent peptidase ImmA (M78 family)